ncbi:MAG: PAS-domain containing protein, partial [Rhodobacteraceae bacterium]|nr:PAS-domain containing protein [Paracoccaceae bacterium]
MIDPDEPLEIQVRKQAKIIEALISRSERGHEVGGSAYSLFQSAIVLQAAVWEKTKDLEVALDTLGRASSELELARRLQERMQNNLADAMVAVEGGFALFSEDRLQVCNEFFRRLLPDVEPLIEPGLAFEDYLNAVAHSRFVLPSDNGAEGGRLAQPRDRRFSSHVLALRNDRWFQMAYRQTSSGNIAVLQTEITDIVRQNQSEKDRLIDQHAHFLQAAFDHMSLGICTFSAKGELLVRNERFGELLGVPLSLLKKGIGFRRITEYIERFEALKPQGSGAGRVPDGWAKTLRRGGVVQDRFRRPDGVSLDIRIHALPDNGFIVSITDVTVETEAAEARQRINQTLERRVQERTAELTEANRLLRIQSVEQAKTEEALRLAKEAAEAAHVSKTRFLAAASHDLLQPINAAKLYISTLKEKVTERGAVETVDRISRS